MILTLFGTSRVENHQPTYPPRLLQGPQSTFHEIPQPRLTHSNSSECIDNRCLCHASDLKPFLMKLDWFGTSKIETHLPTYLPRRLQGPPSTFHEIPQPMPTNLNSSECIDNWYLSHASDLKA